jgi:parallel beta-helix repeat protein
MVLVGVTRVASAATCGGAIPCQCGDTVASDYILSADIGPCPGDGLLPQSNVLLDCQGFTVRGSGDGAPTYGIYLRGVAGVTVQNCVVTGFERGIRLRDTSNSLVRDSRAWGNGVAGVGYGFDLASGALGNVIQGNLVIENADEGIHLGTGRPTTS